MSPLDKYVIFCLIDTKMADVTAAAAGVMRASHDGAVVCEDECRPPSVVEVDEKGRPQVHPACMVSKSETSGMVLVETSSFHSKGEALSRMLPDCQVFQFCSVYETAHRWRHVTAIYLDGSAVRVVGADRGFGSSRPRFYQSGDIRAFEDVERYTLPDDGARFDRALVFDYAQRLDPSLRSRLFQREMSEGVYFRGYTYLEAQNVSPEKRTRKWTAAYEQAIALGIGEPERSDLEVENQQGFLKRQDAHAAALTKLHNAVHRALPDPRKVQRAWDRYFPMIVATGDASGLGEIAHTIWADLDMRPHPDITHRFDALHQFWSRICPFMSRLLQSLAVKLPEGTFAKVQTHQILPQALGHSNDAAEVEKRAVMLARNAIADAGINLDTPFTVLSIDEAEKASKEAMAEVNAGIGKNFGVE